MRYLAGIKEQPVGSSKGIKLTSQAGKQYQIIEGLAAVVPVKYQSAYVGSVTAEQLAAQYPEYWRIINVITDPVAEMRTAEIAAKIVGETKIPVDIPAQSVKIESMSTTNTASAGLTAFEEILLKIIAGTAAAAPGITPIFVHSARGTAIVNASEVLFTSILQQFTPTPSTPAPAATA